MKNSYRGSGLSDFDYNWLKNNNEWTEEQIKKYADAIITDDPRSFSERMTGRKTEWIDKRVRK